jgi:hypothetical protein
MKDEKINVNLDDVGNFPGYEHEPRIVRPEDFIEVKDPMLVLKFYNMVRKGQDFVDKKVVELIREFTKTEAIGKRIDPLSGLGFAILGPEMFNVARWDQETSYLLKNDLYEYENRAGAAIKAKKLETNVEGVFCMFELGIATHELNAWSKYLNSKRELEDKIEYLNNRFSGDLE